MPDTSEQWRPIPGTDGRYEASDQGRIRSWVRAGTGQADGWKRRAYPSARTAHQNRQNHYWYVLLRVDGRYLTRAVHRLVLETYVGPRPHGMEACHGDGDRGNNALVNLRWDTRVSNARDRTRHGTDRAPRRAPKRDGVTGRYLPGRVT